MRIRNTESSLHFGRKSLRKVNKRPITPTERKVGMFTAAALTFLYALSIAIGLWYVIYFIFISSGTALTIALFRGGNGVTVATVAFVGISSGYLILFGINSNIILAHIIVVVKFIQSIIMFWLLTGNRPMTVST